MWGQPQPRCPNCTPGAGTRAPGGGEGVREPGHVVGKAGCFPRGGGPRVSICVSWPLRVLSCSPWRCLGGGAGSWEGVASPKLMGRVWGSKPGEKSGQVRGQATSGTGQALVGRVVAAERGPEMGVRFQEGAERMGPGYHGGAVTEEPGRAWGLEEGNGDQGGARRRGRAPPT